MLLCITTLRRTFCSHLAKSGCVWLSESQDIFENLALEHWLYQHYNFADTDGLLIWSNTPAVVIGRFQNPWLEANVPYLQANGIALARRNSGGGAVYHDLGNLNFSFLTNKQRHRRDSNVQLVADVLKKLYHLNCTVSPRHDLFLDGCKISGSAAKLSGVKAYHHFTLLLDGNAQHMRLALTPSFPHIETNASRSVRSKVTYLNRHCSAINATELNGAVVNAFASLYHDCNIQTVAKAASELAGLQTLVEELRSIDQIYYKTPRFTITQRTKTGLFLSVTVEKGIITAITDASDPNSKLVAHSLVGRVFTTDLVSTVLNI